MKSELILQSLEVSKGRTKQEAKLLLRCVFLALVLEICVVFGLSAYHNGLFSFSSPSTVKIDESQFIDAQIFTIQSEAPTHLKEIKKTRSRAKEQERVISKTPSKGITAPQQALEEENQTQDAVESDEDRGPVAIYAPSPVIPSYLQDQDLRASVVIVFFIPAQGKITPKLVRSSGNEELDALALSTVQKWEFQPAVKNKAPVDAKVSLKIVFKVE